MDFGMPQYMHCMDSPLSSLSFFAPFIFVDSVAKALFENVLKDAYM